MIIPVAAHSLSFPTSQELQLHLPLVTLYPLSSSMVMFSGQFRSSYFTVLGKMGKLISSGHASVLAISHSHSMSKPLLVEQLAICWDHSTSFSAQLLVVVKVFIYNAGLPKILMGKWWIHMQHSMCNHAYIMSGILS